MTTDPHRHLVEAAAHLRERAIRHWPNAERNLDAWQAGYPGGSDGGPHCCPCNGACACPCPRCACDVRYTPTERAALNHDPARQARITIDATLQRLIVAICDIVDTTAAPWLRTHRTDLRLHIAHQLLDRWCTNLDIAPTAHSDCRAIHRHATHIADTITAWSMPPSRPDAKTLPANTAHTDDWCRHCLATSEHCCPVYRAGLCSWCWTFRHAQRRGLPVPPLLAVHHAGGRVNQQLIDHHQPARKA